MTVSSVFLSVANDIMYVLFCFRLVKLSSCRIPSKAHQIFISNLPILPGKTRLDLLTQEEYYSQNSIPPQKLKQKTKKKCLLILHCVTGFHQECCKINLPQQIPTIESVGIRHS
uniref:Uncharacterized protein n=1 Tax=Cacopsylla melanoneura TaxID=428564 RepID=A0A8D8RBF5_9HEMI